MWEVPQTSDDSILETRTVNQPMLNIIILGALETSISL